jgi:DNA-binding transcriptional MerR regulator
VRISQLAVEADVPVATIKFYLREHLLHDGQLTSPTQAQYDASHVRRLQLVRALLGPAGLSVSATRDLLHWIDDPPDSQHDLLGVAHQAVQRPAADDVDLGRVHELMDRWGWQIDPEDRSTQAALADALQGLAAAGFELPAGALDSYAHLMSQVAETEVANVPTDSREAAVRYVVLGTVLAEPVLLALRRLAQQDASARRFGRQPPPPEDDS